MGWASCMRALTRMMRACGVGSGLVGRMGFLDRLFWIWRRGNRICLRWGSSDALYISFFHFILSTFLNGLLGAAMLDVALDT